MEKTAIVYARVSTVRQADDGLPIASQIEQATLKAAAMGAKLLKVFMDEGISGTTSKRPAFQDAVSFCAQANVDYFIVWSTSRFARNKLDAASYKQQLKRHGTRVVYVSCEIDSDTDEGWFSESIFEIVDEHYSRVISKDTRRSMLKNAADGYFNGGRIPFGFITVESGKRKKLKVEPLEAKTVADIFRTYIEGAGTKEIALRLNKHGLLRRGKKWEKNTVGLLLKSKVYTGHVVFNKTGGTFGAAKPESEWITTKSHEAIVTEEDFMTVQKLFEQRSPRENGGSPHSGFVFTGLLRCGVCGASLQIESAKGRNATYRYYNCRSARIGFGCENRRISARELDEWLIEVILDRIFTRERMIVLIREVLELKGDWERERQAKIDALAGELHIVERKQTKLFDLLELHGKDTPNLGDLTRRLRELKHQRERLEKEAALMLSQAAPEVQISEDEVDAATELFHDIIKNSDNPKKLRLFFTSIIKQIEVKDDSVLIEYHPERLVSRAGFDSVQAVHSGRNRWLPNLVLLRTTKLAIPLPDRFLKKAA
jgi:site-specific DNA recombinase